MGLGCFLCVVIAAINSELGFMSITVIFKGKEFKRGFSITKSTFTFTCLFISTFSLLMISAWLLNSHYQQHTQDRIKLINQQNLINRPYFQTKTNRLGRLSQRIIQKSKRLKEEFEFDINQNILLSKLYPSVLKTNSKLSSLYESVGLLSNQLGNAQNKLEQLEISLTNHHLVNELFISGHSILNKDSWIASPFDIPTDISTWRLNVNLMGSASRSAGANIHYQIITYG